MYFVFALQSPSQSHGEGTMQGSTEFYIHFNKSTHHHFPGDSDRGNDSNDVQASFFSRFIFSTALSGVHYYENCFHIHF